MEKVHIESVKLDQEFNNARRKMNTELRNSLGNNEIERLAAIHFHMIIEEDEDLRMEGANEAGLYASVAKQVEATGGQVNFSSPGAWAEFGLSQ